MQVQSVIEIKMIIFNLIFCFVVMCEVSLGKINSPFECGGNGRFEYCIDGIPGCVTGCHCHPGYYFDTVSKICEPNTKLIKDASGASKQLAVHHNAITGPVKSGTADAANNARSSQTAPKDGANEDLSDWLYNQFLKTVENQVINHTDVSQITRRSGSQIKKTKRLAGRKKKRRRRKNKNSIRRKLLRITDNDSVFDSTDSDDSQTDASRSYSSGSSDMSSESDDRSGSDDGKDKHKDQKKFIMINKAPRPPLPSFLFMGGMETPYFPPIGLPGAPMGLPAPAMFPMAPVPPLMFPYPPPVTSCPASSATSVPSTVSDAITNQSVNTESSTTATAAAQPTTINSGTTDNPGDDLETTTSEALRRPLARKPHFMTKNLKKLAQLYGGGIPKLSEMLLNRHRGKPAVDGDLTKLIQTGVFDNAFPREEYVNPQNMPMETEKVNFKYLTDLIHRRQELDKAHAVQPAKPQDTRRSGPMTNVNLQIPPPQSKDDTYYVTLGREIAQLIRQIDSNKQVAYNQKQQPFSPAFNDNSFGSRSFWERYARSLAAAAAAEPPHAYNQDSSEILHELENRASNVINKQSALNLGELEDLVTYIQRPQPNTNMKFRRNNIETNPKTQHPNMIPYSHSLAPQNNFDDFPQKLSIPMPLKHVPGNDSRKSVPTKRSSYERPLLNEYKFQNVYNHNYFNNYTYPTKRPSNFSSNLTNNVMLRQNPGIRAFSAPTYSAINKTLGHVLLKSDPKNIHKLHFSNSIKKNKAEELTRISSIFNGGIPRSFNRIPSKVSTLLSSKGKSTFSAFPFEGEYHTKKQSPNHINVFDFGNDMQD